MRKLKRGGKVAVLIDFDGFMGWFNEHENPALLFEPRIVAIVEAAPMGVLSDSDKQRIERITAKYGEDYYNQNLDVQWVDQGETFYVDHDLSRGGERIVTVGSLTWVKA
jgi:hypothetical protein